MANPDRLSGLDASFLHLEEGGDAHMHVASVLVFEGSPPRQEALVAAINERLDLVPRYRQRLAAIPFGQGRPVWVDDVHFSARYHVRNTALPRPGDDATLRRLTGRVFAQQLDRSKPLWELWLVEGLAGGRFALLSKTHHALVDGVSGVDIASVLFDTSPDPVTPTGRNATGWVPRPLPTGAQLLADALLERATVPGEIARGLRAAQRAPRRAVRAAAERLASMGALAWAGMDPAPPTPYNVAIGPHRRYAWVDAEIVTFKAIKDALGGTLNDVVLSVVARALGEHLRERGVPTLGVTLKAMVPVSVRAQSESGTLGNRVAAMWAPLPVGVTDPREVFASVHASMAELKASGQAVGAQALTELAGLAPPTIMSQAARLQSRQRMFNVVVTNVPGPQVPLYLLGRRLQRLYPVVPLAAGQALGIAVMSYAGRLGFGLLGDHDAMPDLERVADHLRAAVAELAAAAGAAGGGDSPHPSGRATPRVRSGSAA